MRDRLTYPLLIAGIAMLVLWMAVTPTKCKYSTPKTAMQTDTIESVQEEIISAAMESYYMEQHMRQLEESQMEYERNYGQNK